MKTSSSTLISPKGHIVVTHEYQLSRIEKMALTTIAKGLYDWGKPGHVNIRGCTDRFDESGEVTTKACCALCAAGLLDNDPMACHGYQFNINALGWRMVAALETTS